MSIRRWIRSALALAALAAFSAACDEAGTEPELDPAVDADAALADYEALSAIVSGMAWGSLDAMAGGTDALSGAAGAVLEPVAALRRARGGDPVQVTRGLVAALSAGEPTRVPLISETHLGTTFVYDATAGRYTADPQREDAPSDGVRFVLYETRGDGTPDVERAIGHADLTDQGAGVEGIRLRLQVVVEEETVLDYRTAVVMGSQENSVQVDGFLAGDEGRLDFDIDVTGLEAGGREVMDLDFRLAVEARDFVIDGTVEGISDTGSSDGGIDLQVRHGSDSLSLISRTTGGIVDGEVRIGGELFATVEGPDEDPTVTSADGDPLTAAETLLVLAVVDVVEDVFDLVEDLVDPMDGLIVVAIIL